MKNKVLNLIGLAYRANFIISGEESVIKALQQNRLKIVFIASDASPKTVDKFVRKCYYYKVVYILDFSSEELSSAIGRTRKIIGLTDLGFANAIERLMR